MKSITIKGSKRESVGKKATKALRNAGMVPCVVYGGDEPISFSAEEIAFMSKLQHRCKIRYHKNQQNDISEFIKHDF